MTKKKRFMPKNRDNEKGAALVMALLISFLLLTASAGLILSASMNSANVTDITAEQQAYNAAESGIQAAVNVLRYKCTAAVSPCRVKPSPLIDTTKPDYNKANTISYVKALAGTTSNKPGDAAPAPRLSRWMDYLGNAATDRVKLAQPSAAYNAASGFAYTLEVSDPDQTASRVTFNTTGVLYDHDAGDATTKTYGSGANTLKVKYQSKTEPSLDVSNAVNANTDIGTFKVTISGAGATMSTHNRFEIVFNMTVPYQATRYIRGYIEMNASPSTAPKIIFDSQSYTIRGSSVDLSMTGFAMRDTGTRPYGYEGNLVTTNSGLTIAGTLSAPEPDRLLVKSTGYGPRGAVKQLEAIIQSNYFSGLGAPATITMVGKSTASNGNFVFDPGNSNAMLYTGQDAVSTDIIPPIGVTTDPDPVSGDDPNLDYVINAVGGKLANNVQGVPSNVKGELPQWMSTPEKLDATVKTLYTTAANTYDPNNTTGRYFASGTQPTTWGDNASGTGITFCDGDCELGPVAGGGLLIVTGTLTLHGNFSFNGLIIVTGSGGVIRNGGGNGTIQGNVIVSPYLNSSIAGNQDPAVGSRIPGTEMADAGRR